MMNQHEILKKIGQILEDLRDQHQYLTNTTQIDDLEIKLFSAHADFLIDHIEIFRKLSLQNDEAVLNQSIEPSNQPAEELAIELEEINPLIELIDEPKTTVFHFSLDDEPEEMVFDFEKEINVEEVFDRALSEEEKEFLKTKVSLNDNLEIESQTEDQMDEDMEDEMGLEPFLFPIEEPILENEENIVAEQNLDAAIEEVEENKMTLNELLSSQIESRNSGSDLLKKVSGDLKSAISLNDKMLFIKSLFNGYSLSYSEAIEILNRFDSFEAADNFLIKNYAQKNSWEEKQEVVDRFYEYLNRKFLS